MKGYKGLNFCRGRCRFRNSAHGIAMGIPIEFRILNFCSWNRHGNSLNRSSEFGIPLPFLTYLPKKVKMGCGIPNSELLLMELPWRFQGQKFGIRNSIGILNSELLLLESPWQFHEQKFGIGISMDRSLGPKSLLILSEFRIRWITNTLYQLSWLMSNHICCYLSN